MKELYERLAAIHAALPEDKGEELMELVWDIFNGAADRNKTWDTTRTLTRFERDHGYRGDGDKA